MLKCAIDLAIKVLAIGHVGAERVVNGDEKEGAESARHRSERRRRLEARAVVSHRRGRGHYRLLNNRDGAGERSFLEHMLLLLLL